MHKLRVVAIAMSMAATAGLPAAAVAQDERCISRAENQAVVAHLMPHILHSAQNRCKTQLGAASYLSTRSAALARDLQPLSQQNWPAARRALERQAGNALPDNPALLDLGRQAIAEGVANRMDANACRLADDLLAQLAPLPPQNLSNVSALFLEAGLNNSKESPLKVCQRV